MGASEIGLLQLVISREKLAELQAEEEAVIKTTTLNKEDSQYLSLNKRVASLHFSRTNKKVLYHATGMMSQCLGNNFGNFSPVDFNDLHEVSSRSKL